MKILELTDYFYPHGGGGVERVVWEVSKRIVCRGHSVVVVTLNTRKAKAFEILDNMRVYRIPGLDLTRGIGFQLAVSPCPQMICTIARRENPDLIHANNRFFFTTSVAVALKKIFKKPLITTLHLGRVAIGGRAKNLVARVYERTVSKRIIGESDRIIAVSRDVANNARTLGARSGRITVIPNGVDTSEFTPEWSGERHGLGRKRIVFVGRLIFNKGIQYLVDSAPEVLRVIKDAKFLVVGDGPLRVDLERRCKELGVSGAFQFCGFVPNVANVMRHCDLFVRPSLMEGMPLTVLEAMACGLPVVTTEGTGASELVSEDTGILVRQGDTQQLASAITRMLTDPKNCLKMGRNARAKVEREYSWDRTAALTLRAYSECLCLQ